jgi:ubiquinone/menaquinone biosynthesis C-methylase UbiE
VDFPLIPVTDLIIINCWIGHTRFLHYSSRNRVALPFPAGTFDRVLCQHSLQLIPNRARAVREMRRVLAPGGRALVIVLQAPGQQAGRSHHLHS